MVGADDELRGLAGEVGGVALDPGQRPGFGLQVTVHALLGPGELDEPVTFDRNLSGDGFFGFGDLLIDPTQRTPGPVVTVLVVDHPIRDASGLLGGGGRPRLGEHLLIRDLLTRVLGAPFADDLRHVGDAGAQDERQPGCGDGLLVGLGDHPGISHHGHIGELVGCFEGVDDRQHRVGLGLVAFERPHCQWEAGGIGEQPDGDLRF